MGKGGNGKRRPPSRTSARRARPDELASASSSSVLCRILYGFTIVTIWGAIGIAGTLAYFASDLPSTEGLARRERSQSVTLLDVSGRVIARRGIDGGMLVTLKDLPLHVSQAP